MYWRLNSDRSGACGRIPTWCLLAFVPMVFCKPDSLVGERSVTEPDRARVFLAALGQLTGRHARTPMVPMIDGAWSDRIAWANRQIVERAVSELAFRGQVAAAVDCVERLARAAASWPDEPQPTVAVLRRSVECFGFQLASSAEVILTEADVDSIYRGATSTANYEQVRAALLAYLVGHPIHLWKLAGVQDRAVLQWWKTYVRHILMDREPGTYPLRNLVHVCEGPDEVYLERFVAGSGHQ